MAKKRSLNNQGIERLLLFLIGAILLLFLTINSVFLYKQAESTSNLYIPGAIEKTALLYLKGAIKQKSGYLMDCSGYTRSVYKQYNMIIPSSAKEQFAICERLSLEEMKKGNLVFFITNNRDISHAGIYLGANQFIHSPGYMKFVRIDSLTNSYWERSFVCGGKPELNNSITINE